MAAFNEPTDPIVGWVWTKPKRDGYVGPVPSTRREGFRLIVNTRDERGHKPHAHVVKGGTKVKVTLDASLTAYEPKGMKKADIVRARELVGANFGKLMTWWDTTMAKPIPDRIPVPPMSEAMYRNTIRTAKKDEPTDVVTARFRPKSDVLVLTLRSGIMLAFPRAHVREIARIDPQNVGLVEVQPGGDGISFLSHDIDISIPGLLADELGALFARAIDKRRRGKTSSKKGSVSPKNDERGGRRRKPVAA
jgi:hypothetical protein